MTSKSAATPRKPDRLMMARSAQERVRMGVAMFDTARQVALSSIRARHPDLSPTEERVQLFLRLYGPDLRPDQVERVVAHIRARTDLQPLPR